MYSQGGRKFNLPFWIIKELLTMLLHKRLSMVLDLQSNGGKNTKQNKRNLKTLIKLQSVWCQPLWLINCKATSLKPSSLLLPITQHWHYFEKHWKFSPVLFINTHLVLLRGFSCIPFLCIDLSVAPLWPERDENLLWLFLAFWCTDHWRRSRNSALLFNVIY